MTSPPSFTKTMSQELNVTAVIPGTSPTLAPRLHPKATATLDAVEIPGFSVVEATDFPTTHGKAPRSLNSTILPEMLQANTAS